MNTARWMIVEQTPENDWSRQSGPVPGRRFVIRELETGAEDEFWLPATQLTPEIVAQEAQGRADRILAFSKLGNA